jgi:hypothetical protein
VADAKKLYDEFSHSKFSKSEIATVLKMSSTSGQFTKRVFTVKEYGLIDQSGTDYSLTELFRTLHSSNPGEAAFKRAALTAIRNSDTFAELLDEYKTKLPSAEVVAGRLENQKLFNRDKAKSAADVLEKSLRYAGVLDGTNNILPVRDTPVGENTDPGDGLSGTRENSGLTDREEPLAEDTLSLEIPVGDGRKVVVRYPSDLSSDEAKKVGNVLNAVVS